MKLMRRWCFAFLVVLSLASFVYAEGNSSVTYYTRVNIWYEDPAKIVSTNYHRGAIIPFGSKVNIISKSGEKIKFTTDEQSGITFILSNIRKYSLLDTEALFKEYFTTYNPKAKGSEFDKFSSKEKESIENGTLAPGMSKEAVICAYGYPPKHKTPALTSNLWTYWDARAIRKLVTFKNNIVTKTEEINEYQENHPRWVHYVP